MTTDGESRPAARRLRAEALRQSGLTEEDIRRRLDGPGAQAGNDPKAGQGETRDVTLFEEATRLFSQFYLDLSRDAPGTVVEFIASYQGEGTSSIAREFACTAALHASRPILLFDLDFRKDAQYEHFASAPRRHVWGEATPGPAEDIGIDFSQLLRLGDNVQGVPAGEQPIVTHRLGQTTLFVTRLHPNLRKNGIKPHITTAPSFWKELRVKTALTVIDALPLRLSADGLALSRLTDQVVVVVAAESTRIPVVQELCTRLAALDARIAGIVLNKRNFYIPQFLYRWI